MAPRGMIRTCSFANLVPLIWMVAGISPVASCLFAAHLGAQTASGASSLSQQEVHPQVNRDTSCKIVYLGIVGGLETPGNPRSGVVQIRDILRGEEYSEVCAKSFSPYAWPSGLSWVLGHFPLHSGQLTKDDLKVAPRVIIVGHSLGGWAALSVARNLQSRNIPIELTIQIDSVGITDHTVPKNVKAAAIFHARDVLFFLTTKSIKLEDPGQTKLVEDVLVRHAGHESVTRDPRIRELVLSTVRSLRNSSAQQGGPSGQQIPQSAITLP